MKNLIVIFLFIGINANAGHFCSPQAIKLITSIEADKNGKLKKLCDKVSPEVKATYSVVDYNLTAEKNDYAEVVEDLASDSAVGKNIIFTLSAAMMKAYCIQGPMFYDKKTLACHSDHGGTMYIFSDKKDTRVMLQKDRSGKELKVFTGVVLGKYSDTPVIGIVE